MIFRRPDAFIIKHIKFFHAIIFICLTYLLFKSSHLSTFYSYVASTKSIIGESNLADLFDAYMFIAAAVSIIITAVILLLLIKKEKRFTFYAISTAFFLAILVFDIMAYSNIAKMQEVDVAPTVYLAYKDISKIIFYALSVWTFIFLFKATGFDFKTFSLGENVFGVDLTDADSEEVEINFEIDSNEIRTKRKRNIREIKYLYLENRFKINLALFLLIAIIGFSVYRSIENNKEVYYSLNDELTYNNYTIKVDSLYLTNHDYNGNEIKPKGVFVILNFKLKKNREIETEFDQNNLLLVINDKQYYASNKNAEDFSDLGNIYKDQKLTLDYENYFLIYDIPYEFSTKEIIVLATSKFNYKTNKYDFYKVKTGYKKLGTKENPRTYYMGEIMNINAYGINNKIKLNSVDFKNKYKIENGKTINGKEYRLVEYLVPTADDNEEKIIMRLKYEENEEKSVNFSTILDKYAKIVYEKKGELYESNIYSFIKSSILKEENTYYIQVSKDVLNGNDRTLKVKIRDQVFNYKLD